MRVHLKVMIKSLAEEAKIIRHEERKALKFSRYARHIDANDRFNSGPSYEEGELALAQYHHLHHQRVTVVRKDARAAQLAYGFIRGRALRRIEPEIVRKGARRPDWDLVRQLVLQYYDGPEDAGWVCRRLDEWIWEAGLRAETAPRVSKEPALVKEDTEATCRF